MTYRAALSNTNFKGATCLELGNSIRSIVFKYVIVSFNVNGHILLAYVNAYLVNINGNLLEKTINTITLSLGSILSMVYMHFERDVLVKITETGG